MSIKIGIGGTTTLYSTTLSTMDSDVRVNLDRVSTTATAVGTTLASAGVDNINIQLTATRNYVSQMSVQEIDTLLEELDQRENYIETLKEDNVKIKTIGTKKL